MNATGSIAPESAELRLEPTPGGWRAAMLDSWRARCRDDRAMAMRAQLGLPTDRPIVMTGHQPVVFHPGVLVKYLAASALARSSGAHASFLIVDQDETDPGALRIPVRGQGGAIGERTLRLLPAPPPGAPAGWVAPARARAVEESQLRDVPWPFVRDGVSSVFRAFDAHSSARSLAEQGALASLDLARSSGVEGTPALASALTSTALFGDLLARMRDDAGAFVRIHNDAVEAFPRAGVSPLATDASAGVHELPLWRVGRGQARVRVLSDRLPDLPPDALAPRALFMTLLARLGACDLFIHGTGGWEYDRITERLAREWLGVEPAPMTLATAMLRLPLLDESPPTERQVARASWLAHRAEHDPGVLGDAERAAAKQQLLARIADAPRRSAERASLYRSLHELLESSRDSNREPLSAIRAREDDTRRRFVGAGLANDRSWAFALHPGVAIESLARAVASSWS